MKMTRATAFFICLIGFAFISFLTSQARAEPFQESIELGAKCGSAGKGSKACLDFAKWIIKNPKKSQEMKSYCLSKAEDGNRIYWLAFLGFGTALDQIKALTYAPKKMTAYNRSCQNGNGESCWLLAQGYEYKDQPNRRYEALVKGCSLQNAAACGAGVTLFRKSSLVNENQYSNFVDGYCRINSSGCQSRAYDAFTSYQESKRGGTSSNKDAIYTRLLVIRACEVEAGRTCLFAGNLVSRGEGGLADKEEAARLFGINCDKKERNPGCFMSVVTEIENDGEVRDSKKTKYIRRLGFACKSRHKRSCDLLDQIRR